MRRLLLVLILVVPAVAGAQDLSGRALITFESYESDLQSSNGFRQSYDLGLRSALTTTAAMRIFFHAEDFQGRAEIDDGGTRQSGNRVLQPSLELSLTNETLRALLRSDYYDTRQRSEGLNTSRSLERSFGQLSWGPAPRTLFSLNAQRNVTNDDAAGVRNLDELATGTLTYGWRGLQANATEKYSHTTESLFDRTVLGHQASLDYSQSSLGGRLEVSANAAAILNQTDEQLLGDASGSVPIPVLVPRALYGVDDTPSDDRDHPLAPYPALVDGNLEISSGVLLGPTAVSFQNLALDIGRIERLDEIRIVVRDRAGNPLRNGGGPVTWDVYVSEDGQVWTPIADARTSFNRTLSRYEVSFTQKFSRWFKIVNFGVNTDETFVTEIQAYYHTTIASRAARNGTDRLYNGGATVVVRPVKRLTFFYNGSYNTNRREYENELAAESTYLEHMASLGYEIFRSLSIRGEYATRDATTNLGNRPTDTAATTTLLLQYKPTRQLRVTGEVSRQNQVLDALEFSIDTRAIHIDAAILKSLSILLNVGQQDQTLPLDQGIAKRTYLDLTGSARLTRTLRMLLLASLQRVDSSSSGGVVQLLGVPHDDRASAEFIWRPGRPLTLSTRVGYVSGAALSGFTHRVRAEWYPFEDGALVLGGWYDQDIDPVTDRKATRLVFNPRWLINRWATFDLNYTSVSLDMQSSTNQQRSLYATLTLTR